MQFSNQQINKVKKAIWEGKISCKWSRYKLFITITLKIAILILHLILKYKPSLNSCNIFQLVDAIYKQ